MDEIDYSVLKQRFKEQIPYMREAMPEFMDASAEGGACYTASELARSVFDEFGIESKVIFVRGVIENEKAKQIRETIGIEDAQRFRDVCVAEDGWSMGVGVGKDPNGAPNFHSVLYFPDTNEILDLTISQLNRPQYGIEFPDYYYGGIDEYMENFSDGWGMKELFEAEDFKELFCPLIDRQRDRADRLKSTLVERIRGK